MDTSVLVFCLYSVQAPCCSLLLLLELQRTVDDCERSTCLWMWKQTSESWLFLPRPPSAPEWTLLALLLNVSKPPRSSSPRADARVCVRCYPRPAKMLQVGMQGSLFTCVFTLFPSQWDARKRWGEVGSRPIINTCRAENESCFQSELNLFSCSARL